MIIYRNTTEPSVTVVDVADDFAEVEEAENAEADLDDEK